jgi:hypothetical protein
MKSQIGRVYVIDGDNLVRGGPEGRGLISVNGLGPAAWGGEH